MPRRGSVQHAIRLRVSQSENEPRLSQVPMPSPMVHPQGGVAPARDSHRDYAPRGGELSGESCHVGVGEGRTCNGGMVRSLGLLRMWLCRMVCARNERGARAACTESGERRALRGHIRPARALPLTTEPQQKPEVKMKQSLQYMQSQPRRPRSAIRFAEVDR